MSGSLAMTMARPVRPDRFGMSRVAARANRHAIFFLFRPHLTDPDDEFILELALAAGAHYIVTFNRDDFRDAERLGVRVVSPGEFLRIIQTHP